MSEPLLTVGIPTYNRARFLEKILRSISDQLTPGLSSRVEVLVSDNASTDRTQEVCQEFGSKFGFRIRRNDTNIGMDRNVAELTRDARGRFVWWMGDDDWVREGFLEWVCSHIENARQDFFFVPAGANADSTRLLGVSSPLTARLWDLCCQHGFIRMLGTLGHCLFRRELVQDYSPIASLGLCVAHAFGLLMSLKNSQAELLTTGGFDVTPLAGGHLNDYRDRWSAENICDGWYNTGLMVLQLIETGRIETPPPGFFQQFVRQGWPLQFHVYQGVNSKVFGRNQALSADTLDRITRLTALLKSEKYDRLWADLRGAVIRYQETYQTCIEQRLVGERLIANPTDIYSTII